MKNFFRSRDAASKGAALLIALALVVLLTGLALAYLSRTTTDRQLAQSSYNDTSADLLARSALDIVVGDFKQEILPPPPATPPPITRANIQPQRSGDDASIPNLIRRSVRNDPIPAPGVSSLASSVSSTSPSANGRSISTTRWNSHYLVPRGNPGNTSVDSSPVPSFTAPDWVLVTAQGPTPAPAPSAVIGRYAFAVYDEGGLLDMNLAGYPSWSGNPAAGCSPSPTPWLVNVGRKGIMAFSDLTALPTSNASPAPTFPPSQVNNIVGWRNYATTLQSFSGFPAATPSFTTDCTQQASYGDYLTDFGLPPFKIQSLSDKLLASSYPFTSIWPSVSSSRTDQSLMTRQELLRLQRSLDNPPGSFSQNVLQYMGTFSRERNRPAPDWPNLNPGGSLSEGRFNLNNLALVIPNPTDCHPAHGKKTGWQTGKNKNHLCGDSTDIHELFGLFWVKSDVLPPLPNSSPAPGYWTYIGNVGPVPTASPTPTPQKGVNCFRGANNQNDFFQILYYALFRVPCANGQTDGSLAKAFGVGASLIDQYDSAAYDSSSGTGCPTSGSNNGTQPAGCDLDSHVVGSNWNKETNATHTTVIKYGKNGGQAALAYGMEANHSGAGGDPTNGDEPYDPNYAGNNPHRPQYAPDPITGQTQVISHAFSTVGEFGYGIDTSNASLPTLDFSSPNFQDAPVLDFFGYNPISSAYPRAGIVNLYTRNAPVLAAILSQTLTKDPGPTPGPSPTPVVSQTQAMNAANAIVTETQKILTGQTPGYGAVTQTDLTRAIAARLVAAGASATGWSGFTTEQKQSIARALAEMGQTRTWNLLIDVIAQTGKYKPNTDLSGGNFVVEGEKRYWLHISLGRDLIQSDGTPCPPGASGCQVDVLGTQLEEVIE
jgi:hypothetical protein